jgi:hypothetical protein
MLEIIFLIYFSRKIAEIAAGKGHNKTRHRIMAIVLWFGGEITGGIIGYLLGSGIAVYLFAIIGAICGAIASYAIVKNLPEGQKNSYIESQYWICSHCGYRNTIFDKEKCFSCGMNKDA